MKPFTNNFLGAVMHGLLSPDLHQIITGTFRDLLFDWVEQYIKNTYPKAYSSARVVFYALSDLSRIGGDLCKDETEVYIHNKVDSDKLAFWCNGHDP